MMEAPKFQFDHEKSKRSWEREWLSNHEMAFADFVPEEVYREVLKERDIKERTFLNIGAGYWPKIADTKISSPLPALLEEKGARIVPVDIALQPLQGHLKEGKIPVACDMQHLPFKVGSIDGGALLLNILNLSYVDAVKGDACIAKEDIQTILRELHRVLQKEAFIIVSQFGEKVTLVAGSPLFEDTQEGIISIAEIKNLCDQTGFRNITDIPLDEIRIQRANSILLGQARRVSIEAPISYQWKESGAFIMEK